MDTTKERRLAVLFPGVRYSVDCPLLYFARVVFERRGYEVAAIDYGDSLTNTQHLEQAVSSIGGSVCDQLAVLHPEQCTDVVFIAKSIGTVLSGWARTQLHLNARQILLTPLAQTLPYIDPSQDIVIGAGNDPYLDSKTLQSHCTAHGIPLTLIPDVGHRLECKTDTMESLRILTQVVTQYERV